MKKQGKGSNPNSLKNLEKTKARITKDNQPTCESKSNGQLDARKTINYLLNLETKLSEREEILNNFVNGLDAEVKQGKLDNFIKTANLFKSVEKNTSINVQGVQKVFVTQEELDAVNKHIDDIIGE